MLIRFLREGVQKTVVASHCYVLTTVSVFSNGCALEDGLEAAPAVVSENSKVAKEADGESCSSEQTWDKVEPAHSTEAQAEPEPEPQTG